MLISPRRLLVITVNASLMSDRRPNLYLAPSPVLPSRPESAKKDSNEKCAGNNRGDMKRREKKSCVENLRISFCTFLRKYTEH